MEVYGFMLFQRKLKFFNCTNYCLHNNSLVLAFKKTIKIFLINILYPQKGKIQAAKVNFIDDAPFLADSQDGYPHFSSTAFLPTTGGRYLQKFKVVIEVKVARSIGCLFVGVPNIKSTQCESKMP